MSDPNAYQHLNDMTQVETPSSTMVWKMFFLGDITFIWKETSEGILHVNWSNSNAIEVALDGLKYLVKDNSLFLYGGQYCNTSMVEMEHGS